MINTTINSFLIKAWWAFSEPYFAPIYPPNSTAITKGNKISIWITNCPEIPAPTKPAIELTQIKSAAVAAAVLGSAHFFSKSIGDKKIPPPTPIMPLIKPIPPPMGAAYLKLGT